MIVVFTRRFLCRRTNDARRTELPRRLHSPCGRRRREQEHLPLTGQEMQGGAHLRAVLPAEETVELIEHTEAHLLQF